MLLWSKESWNEKHTSNWGFVTLKKKREKKKKKKAIKKGLVWFSNSPVYCILPIHVCSVSCNAGLSCGTYVLCHWPAFNLRLNSAGTSKAADARTLTGFSIYTIGCTTGNWFLRPVIHGGCVWANTTFKLIKRWTEFFFTVLTLRCGNAFLLLQWNPFCFHFLLKGQVFVAVEWAPNTQAPKLADMYPALHLLWPWDNNANQLVWI